jgi:hypothetical protein
MDSKIRLGGAVLIALGAFASLPAQTVQPASEQLITVTPQTLDAWEVTGADKTALTRQTQLVLPAGTQISRKFSANAVILHLITRPVFSGSSSEWPMLSVGPAALSLVRQDAQGRLVLVIGEDAVVDLPWSVPLEPAGAPVDLVLAYDSLTGEGLISMQDELDTFKGMAGAGSLNVVLAAGNKSAWPQDLMELAIFSSGADDAASGNTMPGKDSGRPADAANLKSAVEKLLGVKAAGDPQNGVVPGEPQLTPTARAVSLLEVFTPPSVRSSKREQVSAAIAKAQGK